MRNVQPSDVHDCKLIRFLRKFRENILELLSIKIYVYQGLLGIEIQFCIFYSLADYKDP